ncbi:hypothetical protein [Streptomyces sp. NPDC101150]|uniref:hypothetical protein n=1 Tax=Streptomyces sp. NPDC101150 TaxID=3366114 RepID=UPI00382ADAA3
MSHGTQPKKVSIMTAPHPSRSTSQANSPPTTWIDQKGRNRGGQQETRASRMRFAFYGRVSTEDHQDPEASRARQPSEEIILPELDKWFAKSFAPGQLTATLRAIQETQAGSATPADAAAATARKTITDCDRRLTQYQAALDARADPQLVSKWINETQSQKTSAQQDLLAATAAQPEILTSAQISHMVAEPGSPADRLLAAERAQAPSTRASGSSSTPTCKRGS